LRERVELRLQAVEELNDTDRFDLAWLPSPFIASQVIATAVDRMHAALHPGGWIVVAARPFDEELLASAVTRWKTYAPAEQYFRATMPRLLEGAGFVDIHDIPTPQAHRHSLPVAVPNDPQVSATAARVAIKAGGFSRVVIASRGRMVVLSPVVGSSNARRLAPVLSDASGSSRRRFAGAIVGIAVFGLVLRVLTSSICAIGRSRATAPITTCWRTWWPPARASSTLPGDCTT
jgi:hypothetical protein